MPLALVQLDLRADDLIISSESGPAKGVLTRLDALHCVLLYADALCVGDVFDYCVSTGAFKKLRVLPLMHDGKCGLCFGGRVDH